MRTMLVITGFVALLLIGVFHHDPRRDFLVVYQTSADNVLRTKQGIITCQRFDTSTFKWALTNLDNGFGATNDAIVILNVVRLDK